MQAKVLIAVLPAVVCIAVYMLDDPVKQSLVFIPSSFMLYQFYTTHFVHFTLLHLSSNLLAYFLFVSAAYTAFVRARRENEFWKSFTFILAITPPASSLSWLLASYSYPVFENVSMYGFSTISSAVIGLFGYGIFLHLVTLNAEKSAAFLFVLLFGVVTIPIVYGYTLIGFLLLVLECTRLVRELGRPRVPAPGARGGGPLRRAHELEVRRCARGGVPLVLPLAHFRPTLLPHRLLGGALGRLRGR